MKSLLALGLLAALATACGGKTDTTLTDGGTGPDGEGIDVVHPTPANPFCPSAQPQDGSSCTHDGVKCEYGSDPRYSCNWVASCDQGRWSVSTSNDMYCPTPSTNLPSCPATWSEAQSAGTCSALGTPCHYAEGWCSCIDMGGPPMPDAGMQAYWMCAGAPSVGCPAERPHLGTTCTQPDLQCDYAPCDQPQGLSVRCDGTYGTWVDGFGMLCAGADQN